MKKGQLMGQPFIIIFVVIVISLLLFFGIKVIYGLNNLSEDTLIENFFLELKSKFANVDDLDEGSKVSLNKLDAPNTIEEICFIDFDTNLNLNGIDQEKATRLQVAWSNKDKNVIFVPESGVYDYRKIDGFKVSENPLCENLKDNKVDLVLENKGIYVSIVRKVI